MISITSLLLNKELETKKHVESLAFNRGASTIGETKAIDYIEQELNKEYIGSQYEYFKWTGPTRILRKYTNMALLRL